VHILSRRLSVRLMVSTVAIVIVTIGTTTRGANPPSSKVFSLFAQTLPNVPGKSMTVVVVDHPPGGSSVPHHHAGSVFAYVLAGAVRSQITGGELKTYAAGESFFEPPGSHHLVSANASTTEPARLLAVIVADDGAKLTAPDQ
jgi:quercetin dioxygenase-like cupin family protein